MHQKIANVIDRSVFDSALELAAEWRNEFGMSDTPDWTRTTVNNEFINYVEQNGYWQLMIRRSFNGYWVELFRDGNEIRSVEIIQLIDRKVLKNALDLAAVWRREFGMSDTPESVRDTVNNELFNYVENRGQLHLMIRRASNGYWVELFHDGNEIRAFEVK